jgi:hypothetical protein
MHHIKANAALAAIARQNARQLLQGGAGAKTTVSHHAFSNRVATAKLHSSRLSPQPLSTTSSLSQEQQKGIGRFLRPPGHTDPTTRCAAPAGSRPTTCVPSATDRA